MPSPPLKVLCITRAYPPVVGGMERLSVAFTSALAEHADVRLCANRGGKRALPFFLPRAALFLRRHAPSADIIHLGDPLLTVLLPFLPAKVVHSARPAAADVSRGGVDLPSGHGSAPEEPRAREIAAVSEPRWGERTALSRDAAAKAGRALPSIAVTIHGLDILYPHPLYQSLLRRFLPRVDLALCISRFVETECRKRFPQVRTMVLTPGTTGGGQRGPSASRDDLARDLGHPLTTGPLLLAVARLVPRKGIAWFVRDVLPSLPPETQLLIVGDGPERAAIEAAATKWGTRARIILAGSVPHETTGRAYAVADLLVMPNVPVAGDAEGFGLVALEAAAQGLPVVAADLEGIRDAVIPDETGIRVPPGDAPAWIRTITALLADRPRWEKLRVNAPRAARTHFSWEPRIQRLLEAVAKRHTI